LRSIYHECDLLIAETWRDGVFDVTEPAVLAAILSIFVHEPRRSRRSGPHRQTPSRKHRARHDRLGDRRRDDITERVREVAFLDSRQRECEDAHNLHHAKSPDDGFASTIAAWVRGAPLVTVLELVGADGVPLSPGDFVRTAKQVADLCEQVGRLGTGTPLAETALAARDAVVRSVVAGPVAVPRHEGPDS
jgi:ATP-dependent RNA helicase HelY